MDILSKLRTLSSYRILKPTQLYGPGIEQVVVVLLLPTTYYSYWVSNRKFRENKICDTFQTTTKNLGIGMIVLHIFALYLLQDRSLCGYFE